LSQESPAGLNRAASTVYQKALVLSHALKIVNLFFRELDNRSIAPVPASRHEFASR
jgi:hypothetical protein